MKNPMRRLIGLLMVSAVAMHAHAQEYPSKPIRVIVPSQAGSGTDIIARYFAAALSRELAQGLAVENRVGAGGNIAAAAAAKALPDGYTLFTGTTATHAMNTVLYTNPGYDPERDFVPIGMLGKTTVAIAVSSRLGVHSLPELLAKSKNTKISVALPSSTATIIHDVFNRRAGSNMLGIPYKGSAAALNDLMGGHIDATIDTAAALQPAIQSGSVVGVAVTSLTPTKLLPEVKTVAEQGLPGFEFTGWYALFAPKGTPPDILEKLNRALQKIHADPATQKFISGAAFEPVSVGTLAHLPEFVRAERDKWSRAVRAANLRAE